MEYKVGDKIIFIRSLSYAIAGDEGEIIDIQKEKDGTHWFRVKHTRDRRDGFRFEDYHDHINLKRTELFPIY